MNKNTIIILEKKYDKSEIKSRQGIGRKLDYIETHKVIQRLNDALEHNWSYEILSNVQNSIIDDNVITHVRLTVRDENNNVIVKDGYGSKKINYKKDTKIALDLGSDFKASASDGLKKAATLLGVALDLYGSDEKDDDKEEVAKKDEEKVDGPILESQKKAIETMVRVKKVDLKTLGVTELAKLTESQGKDLIEKLNKVGK